MKIALITYESKEEYTSNVPNEDKILFDLLKSKGLDVTFEIWSNTAVDWAAYDLAIVKSPWDYFNRSEEFFGWLAKMKQLNIKMLNSVDTIIWNADKKYLQDIIDAGLPVIPTLWLNKGEKINFDKLFETLKTDKIIIKPRISGASKNTFAIAKQEVTQYAEQINALLTKENFMVQPFMKEVPEKGEWSFIFFNGAFSHCVLKTAKAGDFRVQHFLGGTIHTPTPPEHLLNDAKQIIDKFASGCLYARVDGVESNKRLHLMELELVEPLLFMFTNENAFENYYAALKEIANCGVSIAD